jgi:signal transduction histidine kinase
MEPSFYAGLLVAGAIFSALTVVLLRMRHTRPDALHLPSFTRKVDVVPIGRDQVMQSMQEPFFLIDQHHRIIDLNDIAHRLFSDQPQQPTAAMIGEPITAVFPDWHRWLDSGTSDGEFERLTDSGESQVYEWRLSAVRDPQGSIRARVILLSNMTRRKVALQRELELALEKERSTLLQQFIQITAHEIRTPLTILGSSIYLLTRLTDPEKRAAKAETARNSIDRITHVLDMALLMVELEHTPDQEFIPLDLRVVLRGVVDSFAARYADRLTVAMRFDDSVMVAGSVRLIAEALRQVVDNACRYSPDQGVVSVVLQRTTTSAVIEISDQGAGISPDDLPLIFDTLYRTDAARSTQGFGIGLTIARKIIDSHGGQITIESVQGSGTTVRILLPVSAAPTSSLIARRTQGQTLISD